MNPTFRNIEAVLLDRDGTVIVDKDYLHDPDAVELIPGAAEGLQILAREGLRLFVVSNQSGIGRGYFSEHACRACFGQLDKLLRKANVFIEDSVWCPHAPEQGCDCRKPGPGMWRLLQQKHGLRPERTIMIGDKREDVNFARTCDLDGAVLVLTGKGREHARKMGILQLSKEVQYRVEADPGIDMPDITAQDLRAGCTAIRKALKTRGKA